MKGLNMLLPSLALFISLISIAGCKDCLEGYYSEPLSGGGNYDRCCPCSPCLESDHNHEFTPLCLGGKHGRDGRNCKTKDWAECYLNNEPDETGDVTEVPKMNTTAKSTARTTKKTQTHTIAPNKVLSAQKLPVVEKTKVNVPLPSPSTALLIIVLLVLGVIVIMLSAMCCKRKGVAAKLKNMIKSRIPGCNENKEQFIHDERHDNSSALTSKTEESIALTIMETHGDDPEKQLNMPPEDITFLSSESNIGSDEKYEPSNPPAYSMNHNPNACGCVHNVQGNNGIFVGGSVHGNITINSSCHQCEGRIGGAAQIAGPRAVHSENIQTSVRTVATQPVLNHGVTMVNNITTYDVRQPRQTSHIVAPRENTVVEHDEVLCSNITQSSKLRHQSSNISSSSVLGVTENEDSSSLFTSPMRHGRRLYPSSGTENLWSPALSPTPGLPSHLHTSPKFQLDNMPRFGLSRMPQESDSSESFSPKYPNYMPSLRDSDFYNTNTQISPSLSLSDISQEDMDLYSPPET